MAVAIGAAEKVSVGVIIPCRYFEPRVRPGLWQSAFVAGKAGSFLPTVGKCQEIAAGIERSRSG